MVMFICLCMHLLMHLVIDALIFVFMHVCIDAFDAFMHLLMHAFIYECIYLHMFKMQIYALLHVWILLGVLCALVVS